MRFFIIFFIISTCTSCTSNHDDQSEIIEGDIISITTPATVISGTSVDVVVTFYGMNGCSAAFNVKANQVGQTIKLRAYYSQPTDGRMCTENLPIHSLTYTFFADLPGVYFFESEKSSSISSTLKVY